jgi:TonB family protein
MRLIYAGVAALVVAIVLPFMLYRSYSNLQNEDAAAAKRRRAANYRGEDAEPKGFFDKLFGDDEPSPEEVAAKRSADSLKVVAKALALAEARAKADADAVAAREAEATRLREEETQRRTAAAAAVAAAAPKPAAEPTIRRMRGQITTDAGVPIVGATVTLRATGRKAAAGADGWFTLEVPGGTDPTLDVEAPGFVSRTARANGDGQVNVRLSTAEAVAVQSMTSAVAAEKRIRTVRPEPEGGYGAFYRYLAGAARMPDDARKQKINGQVQVEFQVNPNGTLSDFRVVQSLGFGCDEEAVRVIQDGPPWSPGKANGEPIIKKVLMPVPFGK